MTEPSLIPRMRKEVLHCMEERPIECSGCKKPIQIFYKEINEESIVCFEMCADCPILQQKLHGKSHPPQHVDPEKGLCCGVCRTPLETIQMGQPLGCTECYSVFGDRLVVELITTKKIPPKLIKALNKNKNQPLHVGKSPHQSEGVPSPGKLTELNEALNEALRKENYEQAAWLRDQIKHLAEEP